MNIIVDVKTLQKSPHNKMLGSSVMHSCKIHQQLK